MAFIYIMYFGIISAIPLLNNIPAELSRYLSRIMLPAVMTSKVMDNHKYISFFPQ
jgi:hypothetical protein